MTGEAHRRKSPAADSHEAKSLLAAALTERAGHHVVRRQRAQHLEQARQLGCDELVYTWTTGDEEEADLRIFYQPAEAPRIVCVELVALDGRPATLQQQQSCEEAFLAELHAAGPLWEHVASYLWERSG